MIKEQSEPRHSKICCNLIRISSEQSLSEHLKKKIPMMDDLEPSIEYSDTGYPVVEPVPIFALSLRPPNKIRLINVGPDLVRAIQVRKNEHIHTLRITIMRFISYKLN